MLQTIADDLLQRIDQVPVGALTRLFVDAVTRQHERDPKLHQVLFEPLAPELVAMSEFETELVELIAEILHRHPEIHVADPKMSAAIAVYTVEALTHKLVIHPTPGMDREAYCAAISRMLANHLAPSTDESGAAREAPTSS